MFVSNAAIYSLLCVCNKRHRFRSRYIIFIHTHIQTVSWPPPPPHARPGGTHVLQACVVVHDTVMSVSQRMYTVRKKMSLVVDTRQADFFVASCHNAVVPRTKSRVATAGFCPVTQDVEILFVPHVLLDEGLGYTLRLTIVLRTAERQ